MMCKLALRYASGRGSAKGLIEAIGGLLTVARVLIPLESSVNLESVIVKARVLGVSFCGRHISSGFFLFIIAN